MTSEHNSYNFARIKESHGQDKMLKITQNKEEFMIPDPSFYVTRVIAPEEEVKRKMRAKELSDILKMQMQQKKEREAKEKKERVQRELEEEEFFNNQFKELEKHKSITRVNPNVMSHQNLPRATPEVIETPKKPIIREEPKTSFEREHGVTEREPYERRILPVTFDVPLKEYRIPHYDNELERLHRELDEKNMEFNNTLNKLKDNFFNISNSKSNIERELNSVKSYIKKKPEYDDYFDILKNSSYFQLPAAYKRTEIGMGRYSKFYFTAYNPQISKLHPKKTTKPKPLEGESRLISWKETIEKAKTIYNPNKQDIIKDKYNTLDDLINGFLSDVHTEDNEPTDETKIPVITEAKDIQLSANTEDLRESKIEEKDN